MSENNEPVQFRARRISRSYTQKINSTPDVIFPLLCPRRELEWLDGWNYQMVYSQSGFAEPGCIFKTKHEISTDTVWIITRHDRENNQIEFVRITPDVVVVNMFILLNDNYNGTTDVNIEYVFTALSEKGNEFIEGESSKQFLQMMKWWEKSMNYFLASGNKLLALQTKKAKPQTEAAKKSEEPEKSEAHLNDGTQKTGAKKKKTPARGKAQISKKSAAPGTVTDKVEKQ